MPDTKVLDAQLGSRHRAALGITEETDAVVVVVSEERGTISFCFSGNIVSNLDGQSLRHALLGLFGRTARKKRLAKKGAPTPAPAPAIRPPAPQASTGPVTAKPGPASLSTTSRSAVTLMSGPSSTPSGPPAAPTGTGKAITPAPGKLMAASTPMRQSGADGPARREADGAPSARGAALGETPITLAEVTETSKPSVTFVPAPASRRSPEEGLATPPGDEDT